MIYVTCLLKYIYVLKGTAEISCHRNNLDESKSDIIALSGGTWAGKSIDEAFYTFLCEIFGMHIMESFMSEEYEDYIGLFREFETKRQFITSSTTSKVVFTLPVSLIDLVKQTHKTLNVVIQQSAYHETVTYSGQKLQISPDTFRGLIEPTIHAIVKQIKKIQKDQSVYAIKRFVVVGELSECGLIRDTMIPYVDVPEKLIIPYESGMAVLKGAVLFALCPKNRAEHVSNYTYGVKCWSDWNPDIHSASKEVVINGKRKCKDIFYTLLSKGQIFTAGFTVSTIISVANNSRNMFDCSIFISSSLNPRYTTDPHCKQLSHVKVPLPALNQDNEIEVMLTFGDNEILVRAKELKRGKMYEQFTEYQDIVNVSFLLTIIHLFPYIINLMFKCLTSVVFCHT